MHAWGAVEFRICLAPKYHGNSISVQSYDFCPHLAKLNAWFQTFSYSDLYNWKYIGHKTKPYRPILRPHSWFIEIFNFVFISLVLGAVHALPLPALGWPFREGGIQPAGSYAQMHKHNILSITCNLCMNTLFIVQNTIVHCSHLLLFIMLSVQLSITLSNS